MAKFVDKIIISEEVYNTCTPGMITIEDLSKSCQEAFEIYGDAIEEIIKEKEHAKDRNTTEKTF